ncbi:PKD domain-containing protein [bacterium]|nr:PKD domain-containing protein [bacterium]
MTIGSAGILRPRVRGYDSGNTYTALGGLSVLVSIANLPPFAGINASSSNVAIGQLVTFDAGNSIDLDGSIAKYEWDFEGDGTYDLDGGTDPGASWTYSAAGRYPARIRVTDDNGAQTVAAVSITVRGAEFIPLAECGFCPGLTLETVNGVPALCYVDGDTKLPYYALAGDSSGQSWGTPVKVHDNDNCNYEVALAVVDGNPAVAFYDDTPGGVMYARATAADGSSWSTAVEIDSGLNSGYQLDLTLINGRPAILHYGGDIVYYTRAADTQGNAWGATVTLDSTAGTGSNPVLLDAVGRPLAVFSRSTGSPSSWRSCEGNDADGGSWGIAIQGSDSDWNSASRLDAIRLQSGLLACFVAQNTSLDELRVKYQPGVQENQWIATKLVSSSTNFGRLRMGIAGGLPFIVFHEHLDEHRLIFVPALDASGNSWGDEILLTTFDDIGLDDLDVGEADGQPVIVYKSFEDDFIRFGTIYH